jgi:DNA-binding response OmpR family regulator
VLLVNQASQTARVFKEAVRLVGAELTVVESPEEGGRCVREDRFEAIFIDPTLTNFSRQGFTRLIRVSAFNSLTPIVLILSPYREKFDKNDESAGVSVMIKPSRPDDLLPYLQDLKRKLMADRRKNRRLAYRTSVNCVYGMQHLKATSVNVSVMGILLEMSLVLKYGDTMELHFQLVNDEPIFRGFGRVVRLERPGMVGLTFEKLGTAERERLRRFIDAHLPTLR